MNNNAVSDNDESERNRQRRQQWLKQTETRRAENNRAAFNRWMVHVDQGKVKYSTLQNYPTAGRRQAGKRLVDGECPEQMAAAALQAQALLQPSSPPPQNHTPHISSYEAQPHMLPPEYAPYSYPAMYSASGPPYPPYPSYLATPGGQGGYCYPPNYMHPSFHPGNSHSSNSSQNVYVLQLGSGQSGQVDDEGNSPTGYYDGPEDCQQGDVSLQSESAYWSSEDYSNHCLLQRQV